MTDAFVWACVASVIAGVALAVWHENGWWLLLCLPAVLFPI